MESSRSCLETRRLSESLERDRLVGGAEEDEEAWVSALDSLEGLLLLLARLSRIGLKSRTKVDRSLFEVGGLGVGGAGRFSARKGWTLCSIILVLR